MPVTPENVEAAVEFLEGTHLIGALDLGKRWRRRSSFLKAGPNPHLVHVGSGVAAMGERRRRRAGPQNADRHALRRRRRRQALDARFMKAAAERTGGYFTQINPDEPIAWRAFELAATLNTPRLLDVKVAGDGRTPFLGVRAARWPRARNSVAVARLRTPNESLPQTVTVTGTLDGKRSRSKFVAGQRGRQPPADYLPRTWAKLEIDRLLADGSQQEQGSDRRPEQGDVRDDAVHVAAGAGKRGDVQAVQGRSRPQGPLGDVPDAAEDPGGLRAGSRPTGRCADSLRRRSSRTPTKSWKRSWCGYLRRS